MVHVASNKIGFTTNLSQHDEISDVMQGGFAALGIGEFAYPWNGKQNSDAASPISATTLVISAIVQAKKYGLAVYDALALLNLCWIMIASASAPYSIAVMNSGPGTPHHRRDLSDKLEIMLGAYIATLSFVGAFGVWVFVTLPHFDITPDNCTLETTAWVFGHHVHVGDIVYRRFWTGVYIIMSIPLVNLSVLTILLYPFTFITFIPFHSPAPNPTTNTTATTTRRRLQDYGTNLRQGAPIGAGISLGAIILSIVFIILNERTIRSNNVESGERQWTLGQIFALLGALFPVSAVFLKLVKVARYGRRGHPKTTDDNASGIDLSVIKPSSSSSTPALVRVAQP